MRNPALFAALALLAAAAVNAETKEFVIIAGSAAIRSAPNGNDEIAKLADKTKLQVLEKREAHSGKFAATWYRVRYQGKEGWISQYVTTGDLLVEDAASGKSSSAKAPYADSPKELSKETLDAGYIRASSNLWTGVELYAGPGKMYVGQVLGGSEHYVDPISGRAFRGLKLRMKGGSIEWKNRDAVIMGEWFIKKGDPALARQEWHEYSE